MPEDVAVVGFDDATIAAGTDPPLTTIRQSLEEMTRALTDLLLRPIAGTAGPDEHVILETSLVRCAQHLAAPCHDSGPGGTVEV